MTNGAHETRLSRGRVLGGLAALGAGTLAAAGLPQATSAQTARRIIDVHHHVAPTNWLSQGGTPDEARVFQGWSVEHTLELMDAGGVATAYASLTVPGHRFDDPANARAVSRACNEYMAGLRRDHPGRFGFFALVPMPNIKDTLDEIAYAYDTLKADGIGLFTSYGGTYLGNAAFGPVFDELNRRRAVVFIHPTVAPCCGNLQPWLPPAQIEYGTDTTRAIAEYIFNGGTRTYSDVKMIWSHAGGTMPFLVQRFINSGNEGLKSRVPDGFLAEAAKCFYDTAQVPSKGAMQALRAMVPASQIVYGTDFPYRDFRWTSQMLAGDEVFGPSEMRAIDYDNAARILRRA